MTIALDRVIEIAQRDVSWSFVRASGPGGQNVNKVASAVQLRFDVAATAALDEPAKARLRILAGRRLTDDGALLIIARNHRTQEQNRREAWSRLRHLLAEAIKTPKPRKATKPTRAAKERRRASKTRRKKTKELRRKSSWED